MVELPSADVLWHCVNSLDAPKERISVSSIYLWSLSIAPGGIHSHWKNQRNHERRHRFCLFFFKCWRNEKDHLPQASTPTAGLVHEKLVLVYVQLLSANLYRTHWNFFQNICWRALNPHMVLPSSVFSPSFLDPLPEECGNLPFPLFHWTEKWLMKEHGEWNPSEFIVNFCLLWRLIILQRARRRGYLFCKLNLSNV